MTWMVNVNCGDGIDIIDVNSIDDAKKAISNGYIELDKLRAIVSDDYHKPLRLSEIHRLVVSYDGFGNHEYVVTINKAGNAMWESIPIGYTLSVDDAYKISEWLKTAIGDLLKITDLL